jgi:folate-binding protein YgfZ
MTLPAEFLAQYRALTHSVGFTELPLRTILSVTGADCTQILQSFTTNDVKKLVPGTGCEAFVTSPQGKTLAHVLIFCEGNQYLVDSAPDLAATIVSHFDRYVITEDVQFADRTAEFRDILVAGPQAESILTTLTGAEPPKTLLAHASAQIAGRAATVRRVEYAGPISYFVQIASANAPAVIDALIAAGATRCETPAVESARLEAGFPLFGMDITTENLPQEVARDAQAISFTKGCYLGQETVARIDAIGHVNRVLVGLKFEGTEVPACSTAILAGDQQIGHVTSATWSPRLAAPLALAYLRRNHAKPGNVLSSSVGPATVIALPLR